MKTPVVASHARGTRHARVVVIDILAVNGDGNAINARQGTQLTRSEARSSSANAGAIPNKVPHRLIARKLDFMDVSTMRLLLSMIHPI